jgi:hypothetical protein
MVMGLLIWLITLLLSYSIIGLLRRDYSERDRRWMLIIFLYHSLLAVAYYLYALSNPSDSKGYFTKASTEFLGPDWLDYYGVGTRFIDFIMFFLVNRLGFTYEACMVLFSWMGFLGFLCFYMFYRERVRTTPKIYGYDLTLILFLLPNLHFWSSSAGKGSIIFFAFGAFFLALNKPGHRILVLLLGGWIIFQIRPHIFYVMVIAVGLGYTFSTRGVAIGYRLLILLASAFLLVYIYQDILRFTGLEDEFIGDSLISHRASELTKATSGIDITTYSIPEKLFAFWFRPLFIDAPGILGFFVSFENLFYLLFFARMLTPAALTYLWNSDAIVKTCLLTFIGVSFALAQIAGNLGLAMRQKSQVMILMLFVILKFIDEARVQKVRQKLMDRMRSGRDSAGVPVERVS